MAERATHIYSHHPNIESHGQETNGPRFAPYQFARSTNAGLGSDDSMPLFLSAQGDDPEPQDFEGSWDGDRQGRMFRSSRLLTGILAASAVAIVVGLFSVEATRAVIVDATASISGAWQVQSATAQPQQTKLTPSDIQLKDPSRLSAPAIQATANASGPPVAAVAPTREEIAAAYQTALQDRAPAPTPPVAAPPARRLDADELATLLKRAEGLIAIGDIPPARLLLQRAAEAEEASAALLLAQTYDPAVLGTLDIRSITPDPAAARSWYQKAARLGSLNAQARLAQIQN